MPEQLSEGQLRRIALGNIRDNQIGGETDGISPEVAEDLGYTTTPEGVREIVNRRDGKPYWPTEEEREIGKAAIEEIRRDHLNR